MKNLILASLIIGTLASCNKKTESKKAVVPKTTTPSTEEILSKIYPVNKGYECELEDLNTGDVSQMFYIDKSSQNKDNTLYHKFYAITEGEDTVSPNIKLSNKQVWMVPYASENDGIYISSPIVTNVKETDSSETEVTEEGVVKIEGAKISFDAKVNEFEITLTEQVINTNDGQTQLNELETFKISNCLEAEYKIQIGLD